MTSGSALSYDLERGPEGTARSGPHRRDNPASPIVEGVAAWFWRTRISVQSHEDFSIGIDFGTSYYETLERSTNTQFGELSIDTRYYF